MSYKNTLKILRKNMEHPYTYSHQLDEKGILHIMAHDQKGNKIGHAKFSHNDTKDKYMQANRQEFGIKGMMPEHTEVHQDHRRRGIASNMYQHATKITGEKITRPPEHNQTEDAKKMWASSKFAKNEGWKKRYSNILDADLQKGDGFNAIKGLAIAGTMALGAQQMGQNTPDRATASVEQPSYEMVQEAPQKDEYKSKIKKLNQNHFMQYATGNKSLSADKTHKVIQAHPELKEKYGHLLRDPHSTSQAMKTDENLRSSVHSKYFNYLYNKFDGDINHIAHAWKYGAKATSKHLKSGKNTKDNPWVKRFFKY